MLYLLLTAVGLLCIYSVAVVVKARRDTPALAAEVLRSAVITGRDLDAWHLNALLAVEDPRFFYHNGVDYSTPGAGITTITQGIGKKFYFRPFKPGLAKFKLVLVSVFALNRLVSKDDQLTIFLNVASLGGAAGEVNGFGRAAEQYFGRKFGELSRDQYLSLVAMGIAPATFNVKDHPSANAERVARIKKLISGEYKPKGLMDVYYGPLSTETVKAGLAPASYFPGIYKRAGK